MKLYIDQGNSRLKFWLTGEGRVLAHGDCLDGVELATWLIARGADFGGAEIRACSVRSAEEQDRLAQALRAHGRISFVRVDPMLLPTNYVRPEQLGVDRWLAVLAVRAQDVAVVIDAGTAFTVDLLANGRHLGGYILPGLALQREVLARRTARVSFPAPDWSDEAPGVTTAACVGHGSLRALCALVRMAAAELFESTGRRAALMLTGGDASHFAALGAEHRPWLMLEGLAAYHGDVLVLDEEGA